MDLLIQRPIIESQMQELPMSKRFQTTVRNPRKRRKKYAPALHHRGNVKKVPNGRFQGLDPGAAFAQGYGAPRKLGRFGLEKKPQMISQSRECRIP